MISSSFRFFVALVAPLSVSVAACDRSSSSTASSSPSASATAIAASTSSSSAASPQPPRGKPLADVIDVAVGQHMSCALRKDHSVWCWAAGEGAKRTIMVDAAHVGVVDSFVCAIQQKGHIACSKPYSGEIFPVPLYRDGVNIVGGPEGYCVDTEDGVLRCGVEDVEASTVKPPSGLPGLKHPRAFSVGLHYGFGLVDSDVWCWDNRGGPGLPKTMAPVEGAAGVAVGREQACVFTEAGKLWCYPLTGVEKPFEAKPVQVPGWSSVKALSMSYGEGVRDALCALRVDGTVACGELGGTADASVFPAPEPLDGATGVEQLATGAASHGCLRTEAGTISCWTRGVARVEQVLEAPAAAASSKP